jgi:mannitol/fructose-specific phosphotransferase system IIA component (Ntr-type)
MYITAIVDSNYEQEQMIAALASMLQSAMHCTSLAKKNREREKYGLLFC